MTPRPEGHAMTSLPRTRRLALCLALAVSAPAMAGEVTVEDLARRLQAIEQRLGTAQAQEGADTGLADLDQRLRVIERKLERRPKKPQ
jgi:phosphate-selective porin OprO/OprP